MNEHNNDLITNKYVDDKLTIKMCYFYTQIILCYYDYILQYSDNIYFCLRQLFDLVIEKCLI